VLVLGLLCVFGASILGKPLLPHPGLPVTPPPLESNNPGPAANGGRALAQRPQFADHLTRRQRRALARAERRDRARRERRAQPAGGAAAAAPSLASGPVVAGFYVNWDPTAFTSLSGHVDQLTDFLPAWLHLSQTAPYYSDARNRQDRVEVEPLVRAHHVPIIPVLDNYVPNHPGADEGQFDSQIVHQLLVDSGRRAAFIAALQAGLRGRQWQGINIDFEQVPAADRELLTQFMQQLYDSFHAAGLLVTEDIPLEDDAFNLEALAQANDALLPMLYDQHSPGEPEGAGCIAGLDWTRHRLADLFRRVPANKVVLALGNYAYDWKQGELSATSLNYQEAVLQAQESPDPEDPSIARIRLDPQTLNPYYEYYGDQNRRHRVWMLDAVTAYNQWEVAKPYRPRGLALWYVGSEDPGLWKFVNPSTLFTNFGPQIDAGALNAISYGTGSAVDFQGEGEFLSVVAQPHLGHRTVTRDPHTGLLTGETYTDYPSQYVVRRYGHQDRCVALTFDDGPDPEWTPQILDILKREGVHATFFVIGENAQHDPGLVAREWREGNELGNHTLTHPDLSVTGPETTKLEITVCDRIIESITGHSTTLFRPPYSIDEEPKNGNELRCIMQASAYGLIAVGESNDPEDWNLALRGADGTTGAARIEESVWQDRNEGTIILLHDAGGERSATVAALPQIIERLQAGGYRFITLSQLRGLPRDTVFPPVSAHERTMISADRLTLGGERLLAHALTTLFMLSILLSVTRQMWMGTLAVLQRRRERRRNARAGAATGGLSVSVIIAAYNEEKVIAQTVRAALDSHYSELEIIVVDDGSTDRTAEVVSAAFGAEPRVRLLRKPNGGKASALNLALRQAQGAVIVAQDADTLLGLEAIGRLTRHFADPRVGAVCGNVRVGNVRNLLTRWQALEYITSQNFDRRAYDLLNCITVVPGAVGAWRREAILGLGGYASDTLAEDTDLTWAMREAGWLILNDSTAVAYTEAPDTMRSLARQRFRWTFGTLQNLRKHLPALFRYGAFGWLALPSLWLYQILLPAISPIMDVMIVWAIFAGQLRQFGVYYGVMVGIELVGAALALWMDRGRWGLLPWLFLQRFVYRQLIYLVILKSLVAAVRGGAVHWGKAERRGSWAPPEIAERPLGGG
jgi:peptidoglycan/xylan/chitin deacetylase (PgdA/CDA1 family)/GT2 family glycosyltransferase